MKQREMIAICEKQKGSCNGCKLNCVYDWQIKCETWCLLLLKDAYIKKYKNYLDEDKQELAERTMQEYLQLEEKYLGKEK